MAAADSRRVAIGDYRWSQPEVDVDLGQHVTWYWVGPDTIHSVTGISDNDKGEDSDPQTSFPQHKPGDSFQLTFNSPGTYLFQCKLHPSVRGEVVVSNTPGDPNAEADPIPEINFDTEPPRVGDPTLTTRRFTRQGTTMRLALDEKASLDAEYWRLRKGKPKRFAGYRLWDGHVGYNYIRFGGAGKHFRARPGHYVALLNATDTSNNFGPVKRIYFSIAG
jgi:plastocyanin